MAVYTSSHHSELPLSEYALMRSLYLVSAFSSVRRAASTRLPRRFSVFRGDVSASPVPITAACPPPRRVVCSAWRSLNVIVSHLTRGDTVARRHREGEHGGIHVHAMWPCGNEIKCVAEAHFEKDDSNVPLEALKTVCSADHCRMYINDEAA